MAKGTSWIGGPLTALDPRSTARVLRQLGAEVSPLTSGQPVRVTGKGRLRPPDQALFCGNSGTTARLLLGLLAGHRFRARVTGDASLRRRPMRRVTDPLELMGSRVQGGNGDGLPLDIRGGNLRPLRYELPVASAQVKSALLLAGYAGGVEVQLRESAGRSRDHTERMLRGLGLDVAERDGWIGFVPGGRIPAFEMQVPGDLSSAAFLLGAAILARQGELRVRGVGLNPTRTGVLAVLARMGATVGIEPAGEESGEPVGDLVARPARLTGVQVPAGDVPGLIDEIPLLAALATRAEGLTVFQGVGELRHKESDRLGLLAANIRAVGGVAEAMGDTLAVEGMDRPPAGRVITGGDHRIAMAFAVLNIVAGARVRIDRPAAAEVSFPRFQQTLRSLMAKEQRGQQSHRD
jgi:3-phosphoshikimate 1-carboxyvinyltransferase